MFFSTILFLGAGQAAFLVALIVSKNGKTLADALLAIWISALGVHHLIYGLYHQGIDLPAITLNLNAGVPLLQGPFLFLYVSALTSGRRRFRPVDSLHFLPFLAFALYVALLLPGASPTHPTEVSVFDLSGWITAFFLGSVPVYALASLSRLRRHGTRILDLYSERSGRDLTWLRRIVLALLAVWAVVIFSTLAAPALIPALRHRVMGVVTLFLYAIGYFGWRQFGVVDPKPAATAEATDEGPKYERSGLGEDEIPILVGRLESHLERDRPYLEPGVSLMQIANELETTPNHLSQAINQGMGKNFHELINERRVEDFKRRALDPRNRHRTLLAVAFDSGFNSKSSFNRVFKQLAGMSPRQFLANRSDVESVERTERTR